MNQAMLSMCGTPCLQYMRLPSKMQFESLDQDNLVKYQCVFIPLTFSLSSHVTLRGKPLPFPSLSDF